MSIQIQDASLLPKDFVVFYCWQDQLDKKLHRFLIRDAINSAIGRIQQDLPDEIDLALRLDCDTANRAGAIDIANTILEKIQSSSMIVADVTPVIQDTTSGRYYPNPNVMLELGYGARALGWSKVVGIYNNHTANDPIKPEDLPFDIRHRRLSSYSCSDKSQKKLASKHLGDFFVAAIRAVIEEISSGVFDQNLQNEPLRRTKDLRLLRQILCHINRNALDQYCEDGLSNRLYDDCNYFWLGFEALVCSSHFRFYDKKLENLVDELWKIWGQTVTLVGYCYYPTGPNQYGLKSSQYWDDTYRKEVDDMRDGFRSIPKALKQLLDHVHHNYPEIDLDETDRIAWNNNLPFIRGDHFRFDDPDEEKGDELEEES
jgi:hypothetical protein